MLADPIADLTDLTTAIRSTPARTGETIVVAIDGPSGSGKTTLSRHLSAGLSADVPVPIVHLDDIYPGWDGLADTPPRLLDWILLPLARSEPARYRRYDWVENQYAEWHDVPASPVLIIEGSGSGSSSCAPYLSYLIWIEADRDVRFTRGIARDGDGYLPHWGRWARQEESLFSTEKTRERADVRIQT
jgi:uridine kinase